MAAEKLNRKTVRILRKVQKFLIEEPRRFDMAEGVIPSSERRTMLEQPPCGTACCIAGSAYVIDTNITLNHTRVGYGHIEGHLKGKFGLTARQCDILFYLQGVHIGIEPGVNGWPRFYTDMYHLAKTPLERACVGVARIEHFIATNGRE